MIDHAEVKAPYIVDSHNKVLKAWAECRAKLSAAPRLLTLDHHTDTSKPFRNFLKGNPNEETLRTQWLSEIDFRNSASVDLAIQRLGNDEHIVAAIKSDIISSAFVIAHNAANTGLDIYREHQIACRNVTDPNSVLESQFLDNCISEFEKILSAPLLSQPYILDIDLDYFNTKKSVNPNDPRKTQSLFRGAALVTIATEPEYVKSCSLEPGLEAESLLSALAPFFA